MQNLKNIPYVKRYNDQGELVNPITKSKPYPSRTPYKVPVFNKDGVPVSFVVKYVPNRRERRAAEKQMRKVKH